MKRIHSLRDQLDAISDSLTAQARLIHATPITDNYRLAKYCRLYASQYAESQRLLKEFAEESAIDQINFAE